MARTRQLQQLEAEAYQRADTEGETDRHPTANVDRYLNQGGAELWDILIAARGADYYRATPAFLITTQSGTTTYSLTTPSPFYQLISASLTGQWATPLVPFNGQEEPLLRLPTGIGALPTHYQLRRHADGSCVLEVLPIHASGYVIQVDYVQAYVDMVNPTDTFDGINGWEEYLVDFAARCMAVKDGEVEVAAALLQDMERLKSRIQGLAPKRDMHRARRVKDVRGARFPAWMARRW